MAFLDADDLWHPEKLTRQMMRPVVGTKVGDFPKVVLHQKTGRLVAPDDQNALGDGLLLRLDQPRMAIALGEAARNGRRRL